MNSTSAVAEVFLDTNVLLYALSDDEQRKAKAGAIIYGEADWIISTQVLIEFSAVCLRKKLLPSERLLASVEELSEIAARVVLVDPPLIEEAIRVQQRYRFSWFDSLIVTSAVAADCRTLYSEDMQDGQQIGDLRIVNPFA